MSTPTIHAIVNNVASSPNDLNQLLAAHGLTGIYEGTSLFTTLPVTTTSSQALTGTTQVSQPFTMSGSALDRVTLPLSVFGGVGSDVVVTLQTDSGGAPSGTVLAQVTVPKEFLQISSGAAFSPEIINGNGWITQRALPTGAADPLLIDFGSIIVAVGGSLETSPTVTTPTNQVSSAVVAAGTVGTWQAGPVYPSVITDASGAATNGYIFVFGGRPASNSTATPNVYAASIATDGSIGQWISQPALPTTIWSDGGAWGQGCAAQGNYIYLCGGSGTSNASHNMVGIVQVDSAGNVVSYTSGPPLPVATKYCASRIVSGYLVNVGHNASSVNTVAMAPVLSSGQLGGWQTLPVPPQFIGSLHGAMVVGNTLFVVLGENLNLSNYVYSLTISPNGDYGSWIQQANYPIQMAANAQSSVNGTLVSTGGTTAAIGGGTVNIVQNTYAATVQPTNLVSVPLQATGLTSGNKYHVVCAAGAGQGNVGGNIAQIAYGSSASTPLLVKTGSSWSTLPGLSIPMTCYLGGSPPSGRLVHLLQDVGGFVANQPAAWSWWQYNNLTGQPTCIAETTSHAVSSVTSEAATSVRYLTYDASTLQLVSVQ